MKLWKFILLAAFMAWFGRDGARGQQRQPVSSLQEDCSVTFNFTAVSSGAQAAGTVTAGSTGTTPVIDNRQVGCLDWLVTYEPSSVVATVSLAFQTALDVGGLPVTWSNYPGTLISGINPNTAVTTGGAVTETTGTAYPFLRMNMTVLTGAGARIQGKLYGWKRRPVYVSGILGICPGTIATPCVVVGPGADGAAVVGSPVRIGGKDGSGNTEDILTNVAGNLDPAGLATAQADAATNTPNVPSASGAASVQPVYLFAFNGTTWDRVKSLAAADNMGAFTVGVPKVQLMVAAGNAGQVQAVGSGTAVTDGSAGNNIPFSQKWNWNGATFDKDFICPNRAMVTLTDATVTALVTVSGTTVVRVCQAHGTTSGAGETFSLIQGTGVACAGAPATIDSYVGLVGFTTDYTPQAALRTSASNGLCVSQSGAAQTAVVWISYVQY